MAERTAIEWCDRTWSPWEGCTKVGPGCDHCYAERMNRWLHKGENWGPGAPRLEFSEAHWDKLIRWNDAASKRGEQPKVFPSMCDPLDNEVHAGLRDRFWRAIENTPSLTWLVLTKRIGNAQKMLPQAWLQNRWPKNLWLGATVVNQQEADRDIQKLLQVPARVRFLSIEPMLGPIGVLQWLRSECWHGSRPGPGGRGGVMCPDCNGLGHQCARLHWVICGGESGPGARPMHPDWPRSLRDQCSVAGVPFLFKQWGEWTTDSVDDEAVSILDYAGVLPSGDAALMSRGYEIPFDCGERLRAANNVRLDGRTLMCRVGKKAAGRLLDGVEHNGFPVAAC